jgi:putative thiamine transport system permease protein
LHLALVIAAIGLWRLAEVAAARLGRRWLTGGARGGSGLLPRRLAGTAMTGLMTIAGASVLGLAVWSLAYRWPYPRVLPESWTLDNWVRQGAGLWWTGSTTLIVALAAAAIALALTVGCLENEQRRGLTTSGRGLWLLYTPLLVPQVGFLFGAQILAARVGIDGTWVALIWSHLLFVLPYVFLSLADPYRSLDPRFARAALCLGASPDRVFWRVKLPMLLRPVLFAAAVGFAVSVAQYLPTLFAGAGRFATLTTEAVALAGGGDRRVLGVYAFLQTLLPLLAFAAVLAVPGRRLSTRRHA